MSQILSGKYKIDEKGFDKVIPLRLSCVNSFDWPIVVSLWFIYKDGKIYCATQKNAKIVEHLQKNPKCGFEIASDEPPYKGIRGQGKVRIIESEGKNILEILMNKYLGQRESKLSQFLKQKSESEVAIEITLRKVFKYDYSERMSGVTINER